MFSEAAKTFVKVVFIPLLQQYASKRGLSERLARRRLERSGWTVWRPDSMGAQRNEEAWPSVRKKYQLLEDLIGKRYEELEYIARVHHGMPDFVCCRQGEWKFVECKFGHEQLSSAQRQCIRRLRDMGFAVEIYKIAEPCTKTRIAFLALETGETRVKEKQLRLKQKWKRT